MAVREHWFYCISRKVDGCWLNPERKVYQYQDTLLAQVTQPQARLFGRKKALNQLSRWYAKNLEAHIRTMRAQRVSFLCLLYSLNFVDGIENIQAVYRVDVCLKLKSKGQIVKINRGFVSS